MALKVAIYKIPSHRRSRIICDAFAAGIKRNGDLPIPRCASVYNGIEADCAAFYGVGEGRLDDILADYSKDSAGAVHADLGWFERRKGGRWSGYHKVTVNDRHPTAYFRNRYHDATRAIELGLVLEPWQENGSHILLAGMGDKGALAEGYEPEQWERATIAELRKHTDRAIVYRPKPSWLRAQPIPGTTFSANTQPLRDVLTGCHAVVTHHSNVAVDGLIAGVPAFCVRGAATVQGLQDFSRIEQPHRPSDRGLFLCDLAYCQWTPQEIANGEAWAHLKNEGLLRCA